MTMKRPDPLVPPRRRFRCPRARKTRARVLPSRRSRHCRTVRPSRLTGLGADNRLITNVYQGNYQEKFTLHTTIGSTPVLCLRGPTRISEGTTTFVGCPELCRRPRHHACSQGEAEHPHAGRHHRDDGRGRGRRQSIVPATSVNSAGCAGRRPGCVIRRRGSSRTRGTRHVV